MIDTYAYGRMVIDGTCYPSDLIIYPDRIDANWWREQCHQVRLEDIEKLVAGDPEYLIIGTGETGLLNVLPEVQDYLIKRRKTQLVFVPTEYAYEIYNRLCTKHDVVGAFHLAC